MIALVAQGTAETFDWAREFRPFSGLHWLTTAISVTLMAASSALGYAWRATHKEYYLRRTWGVFVLVAQVGFVTYYMWPPFYIDYSLPLHICDLAGWIAGFALLTQRRWLRTILYYWGIGLSTQAFITPVLREEFGYATAEFWMFWGLHVVIVGSAVYDLVVLRYRPTWRDFRTAVAITAAYTTAIFIFNIIAGANYLFIGPRTPENPTIVDHLGPWPLRVLWLYLIVLAGFAVFTIIWPGTWRRRPPAPDPGAPGSP